MNNLTQYNSYLATQGLSNHIVTLLSYNQFEIMDCEEVTGNPTWCSAPTWFGGFIYWTGVRSSIWDVYIIGMYNQGIGLDNGNLTNNHYESHSFRPVIIIPESSIDVG